MSPSTTPLPRRRWPFVLLLIASLAWLGLVAGTAIGAAWFVPEGSGLAGPAIALGYGVLGLLAGVVLGALLGWKAGHGLLRAATVVVAVLAVLTAGFVVWRIGAAEGKRWAESESPLGAGGRGARPSVEVHARSLVAHRGRNVVPRWRRNELDPCRYGSAEPVPRLLLCGGDGGGGQSVGAGAGSIPRRSRADHGIHGIHGIFPTSARSGFEGRGTGTGSNASCSGVRKSRDSRDSRDTQAKREPGGTSCSVSDRSP